jgi:hypothetical protein
MYKKVLFGRGAKSFSTYKYKRAVVVLMVHVVLVLVLYR